MKSTEELIASLSSQAGRLKPVRPPLALFAAWLGASLAYAAVLLFFSGLRGDWQLKLHAPLFMSEIALLAGIVITSGISAVVLSYPDMYQKRWVAFTPLVPLGGFLFVLCMEWMRDTPPAPLPPHGMECLLCITLYSLVPAVLLLALLRRQATTHYYMAGGIALLAANSIGCLTLRLAEQTDSMRHLLEWHYLPMIGFGMLGIFLGRKILKW